MLVNRHASASTGAFVLMKCLPSKPWGALALHSRVNGLTAQTPSYEILYYSFFLCSRLYFVVCCVLGWWKLCFSGVYRWHKIRFRLMGNAPPAGCFDKATLIMRANSCCCFFCFCAQDLAADLSFPDLAEVDTFKLTGSHVGELSMPALETVNTLLQVGDFLPSPPPPLPTISLMYCVSLS